jgi:hypothetical protein
MFSSVMRPFGSASTSDFNIGNPTQEPIFGIQTLRCVGTYRLERGRLAVTAPAGAHAA